MWVYLVDQIFVCFSRWTNNLLEIKDYFLENNDEYAQNIDNIIKNYKKYNVNKYRDDTTINYITTFFNVNDKIIGNLH